MRCIVPLAGPDFVHPTLGVRALYEFEGRPLIERTLTTRPWADKFTPEDYVFVLRDLPEAQAVKEFLLRRWPGAGIVTLSGLTGGAMFSVAAALAMVGHIEEPICVDLADILFEAPKATVNPARDWDSRVGARLPYFISSDEKYSYLDMDEYGLVRRTAEKRVISDRASAGVYFFQSPGVYLQAMAHSIAHREELAFNGVLFVCPMMNGVFAQGLEVTSFEVRNVIPVGKIFG